MIHLETEKVSGNEIKGFEAIDPKLFEINKTEVEKNISKIIDCADIVISFYKRAKSNSTLFILSNLYIMVCGYQDHEGINVIYKHLTEDAKKLSQIKKGLNKHLERLAEKIEKELIELSSRDEHGMKLLKGYNFYEEVILNSKNYSKENV